jgi:CRISPR-associated protein Cas1
MRSLYVSQQGCTVSLAQEQLIVSAQGATITAVPLPLLEQVLIFGQSQITTQAIRACLHHDIPIVYLSRLGYCYGRVLALQRGYRALARAQQALTDSERLQVARAIVRAKLANGRTLLLRQQRHHDLDLTLAIQTLAYLATQVSAATSIPQLMGYEGAAAGSYFEALGRCFRSADFAFVARSRRPPRNPINALLSFGYMVVWNHLLTLIELQDLDPYAGCLHTGSDRHAALASDLIEEFRAPLVDSLVLQLINGRLITPTDFDYRDGGCFLGTTGRQQFLRSLLQRMEERLTDGDPRWALLMTQVRRFKQFVYHPEQGYAPYLIR